MIFALHYFLWFSALTPIYGYVSVYANTYANVSPRAYGILNMILPFTAILVKPVFCSLADRHRAYRTYFILFLILASFGWGSFGVLPFLIDKIQGKELVLTNWIIICIMTLVANLSMSVVSCLSDAFAVNLARKNKTSYGAIRLWGTIGWGLTAILISFINKYDKLPLLVPGLLVTILFLFLDVTTVILWKDKSDFKLDKPLAELDEDEEDLSNSSNNSLTSPKHDLDDFPNKSCVHQENFFDSTNSKSARVRPNHLTKSSSEKGSYEESPTHHRDGVDVKFSDTSPPFSNASPANGAKPIYGAISNNANSIENAQSEKEVISLRLQLKMLAMVIETRRSLIRYMILFTISGALISMQWSYFFLYLKETYSQNFTYVSGLSMVGQSMLGELPFFIVSQKVIDYLGRSRTLSLSIASIGVRYLLYVYLLPNASMYFVILIEAFQGPNFGLFYVVMTEVGMDYSQCDDVIMELVNTNQIKNNPGEIQATRRALRATMQGLVSACYEGLGLGIGSVIGGSIIYSYDYRCLWISSAIIAISAGLINLLWDATYQRTTT